MPDSLFFDAPIIEQDDFPSITDTYLYVAEGDEDASVPDAGTDAAPDVYLVPDLAGGQDEVGTDPFLSDDEDEFLFLAFGPGTGAAIPDSATPAPPEAKPEPPVGGVEWEMKLLNSARYTATGAYLQGVLTGMY